MHTRPAQSLSSPSSQRFISTQLPPANEPPVPHKCGAPSDWYPSVHSYSHSSPVAPEQSVGECSSANPSVHWFASQAPPANAPSVSQTCDAPTVYPTSQAKSQTSLVAPAHSVCELTIVSPSVHWFASQAPPANAPSVPQTCDAPTMYPASQVYTQVSPAVPEHSPASGELSSVTPPVHSEDSVEGSVAGSVAGSVDYSAGGGGGPSYASAQQATSPEPTSASVQHRTARLVPRSV